MTGAQLREIRKANRLSQEAFGALVGVGRQCVSDWEREENPIIGSVEALAYVIGKYPHLLPEIEVARGLREPPF